MSEAPLQPQHTPFSVVTVAAGAQPCASEGRYVLAEVGFGNKAAILDQERPVFQVGLPLLTGEPVRECWLSHEPVTYGRHASITYSENGSVLFGHLLLEEADFPDFRIASETAYRHVFELLQTSGYGYLLRMWNYFPAITVQQGELNRYQTFCLGRQDALDANGNFDYSPPAATAIGTQQAGLQLYFLAAKHAGMQLENPRQTSAFLYPRQYGPVSPAFSRATVKDWGQGKQVYISGTTSIVGHATLHIGDPLAQLEETLRNLEALLGHGDDTLGLPVRSLRQLTQLKVYIHDPASLPAIQERLERYFDQVGFDSAQPTGSLSAREHSPFPERSRRELARPAILYLQGDVCRADLMVEMEGIYA